MFDKHVGKDLWELVAYECLLHMLHVCVGGQCMLVSGTSSLCVVIQSV